MAALIVGLALAAAPGCGGDEAPAAAPPPGPRPALVRLGDVRAGTLTEERVFLGYARAQQAVDVAPALAGRVATLEVREGDRVEAGAVLVTLDPELVEAEITTSRARERTLQAELAQARRQLQRVEGLAFPVVSEPEKEEQALAVATLEAQVAALRAERRQKAVELERHVVPAPFAGVVSARHVDPGAWVTAGQPVVSMVGADEVEVMVGVAPELAPHVAPGKAVRLRGDGEVAGRVAGVVPRLDPATRTLELRVVPDARPPWLVAGRAVEVALDVTYAGEGVILSRDALVRGPVDVRVIRYADGKGEPIRVDILASAGQEVLVRGEGLAAGDRVVTRGNQRLRPGQPLQVAD